MRKVTSWCFWPGNMQHYLKVPENNTMSCSKPCEWNWYNRSVQMLSVVALKWIHKSLWSRVCMHWPCSNCWLKKTVIRVCSAKLQHNTQRCSFGVEQTRMCLSRFLHGGLASCPCTQVFLEMSSQLLYLYRCRRELREKSLQTVNYWSKMVSQRCSFQCDQL